VAKESTALKARFKNVRFGALLNRAFSAAVNLCIALFLGSCPTAGTELSRWRCFIRHTGALYFALAYSPIFQTVPITRRRTS
jgi:hypothetical protein